MLKYFWTAQFYNWLHTYHAFIPDVTPYSESTNSNKSVFFMKIGNNPFSAVKQHHILFHDIIRAALELTLYAAFLYTFLLNEKARVFNFVLIRR